MLYKFFWLVSIYHVIAEEAHAHGDWEAEQFFDLHGAYTWTFEKVDGDYADANMTIVMIPIAESSCNQAGLEAVEAEAGHMFEACPPHSEEEEEEEDHEEHYCTVVNSGDTLVPNDVNASAVVFDADSWVTVVHINHEGCVAVFTAHVPSEFNAEFRSANGAELLEFPSTSTTSETKKWGAIFAANLLCSSPAFMAIVFFGKIRAFVTNYLVYFLQFAFGVLISISLFHIYPEAMHLLNFEGDFSDGHDAEVAVFWTSGIAFTSAILGLLAARLARIASGASEEKTVDIGMSQEAAGDDVEQVLQTIAVKWNSTSFAILVGDAAHNFVDGVVIGTAFLTCSNSFAWTITTGILLHEAAHEVADILVLFAQGFSTLEVVVYNFLSGAISILGSVLVFEADISSNAQGLLLAFGAGTFVAVAMIDILPEIEILLRKGRQWASVIPFFVGFIIMGLLLLNHEHCEPVGGGGHAGHNH